MLSNTTTLPELASLIDRQRSPRKRANYFQKVYEQMYSFRKSKLDIVSVRFDVIGTGVWPNYQLLRSSDGSKGLIWGSSHKPCDQDFLNGWKESNLTHQSFSPAEINSHRHHR